MSAFVAFDFETANEDRASACSVGAVRIEHGRVVAEFSTLIDPEDEFSAMNIWVHGITPDDVRGAPTFPEAIRGLFALLDGTEALVAHNASFDIQVLMRAGLRYELDLSIEQFACTLVFSRKWWPGLPTYGLGNMVESLEIHDQLLDGSHHEALWDARAAGLIAIRGLEHSGSANWSDAARSASIRLGSATTDNYRGCVSRYRGPSSMAPPNRPVRDPDVEVDPNSPLAGVTVTFTGTLSHLTRREAAQMVVDKGGEFSKSVTRATDLLVVGRQDLEKLRGHDQSTSTRRAIELAAGGHHIEVIDEADFIRLLAW